MDRLTRKELKKDAFAREVGHTVDYLSEHRKKFVRYGTAALVVVVLAAGYYYYSKRQHAIRESELAAATLIQNAPIGQPEGRELAFPTVEARNKAATKAFTDLAAKYPSSDEGSVAKYYLGTIAADENRLDDAARWLNAAVEAGSKEYASLAKLTLAQVEFLRGRTNEAEKLLRDLIAKPTTFVSKDQATLALARILVDNRPNEARRLLEPLRTKPGASSRAALTLLGELPREQAANR